MTDARTEIQADQRHSGNLPADCVVDFDIYAPPGAEHDYFGAWLSLQRPAGPGLVWTTRNGGHWIATRGDVVRAMWVDAARLSSEVLAVTPGLGETMRLIPLQQDGAEHKTFRSAVMKGFGARHIIAMEPQVTRATRDLAETLRSRGRCEFMADFAEVLPLDIFLTLIDVPVSDRMHLRPLGAQLTRPDGTMSVVQLRDAVDSYLWPYIEARMTNPGGDLFSRILAETVDGRAWTAGEAQRMARNILFAGLDTVAAMIGMATMHLAANPADQALLRDRPDCVPQAADELMRRYPSAAVSRNALCDIEVDGLTIRAGEIVYLPSVLHNLDPACFDDPQAFRLDRALNAMHHTTLGAGPHRCVGAGLARMELIAFLREWLVAIPPFRLDPHDTVRMKAGNVGTCTHLPLVWD